MKKTKERVINLLKDKFEITKIKKKTEDEIQLMGEFIFNGKTGKFTYNLGTDEGVDSVDFYEEDYEDIYKEIMDWVNKHVEWDVVIKVDGKEI